MTQTERQLRQAFRRSGLWRPGYTYADALAEPLLAWCIAHIVEAEQRRQAAARPQQRELIA